MTENALLRLLRRTVTALRGLAAKSRPRSSELPPAEALDSRSEKAVLLREIAKYRDVLHQLERDAATERAEDRCALERMESELRGEDRERPLSPALREYVRSRTLELQCKQDELDARRAALRQTVEDEIASLAAEITEIEELEQREEQLRVMRIISEARRREPATMLGENVSLSTLEGAVRGAKGGAALTDAERSAVHVLYNKLDIERRTQGP